MIFLQRQQVDGAKVKARRLTIRDDCSSDWHKGKQRIKDDCESFALGSWVDAALFTEIGKD